MEDITYPSGTAMIADATERSLCCGRASAPVLRRAGRSDRDRSVVAEREVARRPSSLVERLVAPMPPGVVSVDVEQELRDRLAVWTVRGDHRADVEERDIGVEDRADRFEAWVGQEPSVEPGEVTVHDDESGHLHAGRPQGPGIHRSLV